MIKKHLKLLVITSIITVLPIFMGLIIWSKLPDQIPIHWNMAGEVDNWSSKPFAVLALPLILLALQWVCALATAADPKKQNHTDKMLQLAFWIIPVISIVLSVIVYATAMGQSIRVEAVLPVLLGLVFAIIGNYMPKCKQNYTIGIKIPWTLNSEANWNKTHRFAGWTWTVGGIAIMLIGFLPGTVMLWIFLGITLVMALVPMVYSFILHKKGI